MTTEVFKEMKDFSISELEEVISLAKEELAEKKRAAQHEKLKEDFIAIYNTLINEGIDIHYMDPCTEEYILLNCGDHFYFN